MLILQPNSRNDYDNTPVKDDLPFIVHMPPLSFGHIDRPSRAWLRTIDQFVLLRVRAGIVTTSEVELALTALANMNQLKIQSANREYLMLRGLYFDYMGSVTFFIDLLHDVNIQPSYTANELNQHLHNIGSWYNGQTALFDISVQEVYVDADDFYPIDDLFYRRVWEA